MNNTKIKFNRDLKKTIRVNEKILTSALTKINTSGLTKYLLNFDATKEVNISDLVETLLLMFIYDKVNYENYEKYAYMFSTGNKQSSYEKELEDKIKDLEIKISKYTGVKKERYIAMHRVYVDKLEKYKRENK